MYTFRVVYYLTDKDIYIYDYIRVRANKTVKEAWLQALAEALDNPSELVVEKLILLHSEEEKED